MQRLNSFRSFFKAPLKGVFLLVISEMKSEVFKILNKGKKYIAQECFIYINNDELIYRNFHEKNSAYK